MIRIRNLASTSYRSNKLNFSIVPLVSSARLKSSDPFQPPTRPMAPKPKNEELQKKLREKTPIGKLDELPPGQHPHQEKDPLPAWPNNTNPNTGEVGGPRGPEPTRYGDWERKGRRK